MDTLDKKYLILHKLYKKLYSLAVLDKKNEKKWLIYEDWEEGSYTAELKNTSLLDIDLKIRLHYIEYLRLKEEFKNYHVGDNGRIYLF